jgi:hypothetical protein
VHLQAEAQPIKPSRYSHGQIVNYRFIIGLEPSSSNASITPSCSHESIIHKHVVRKRVFTLVRVLIWVR